MTIAVGPVGIIAGGPGGWPIQAVLWLEWGQICCLHLMPWGLKRFQESGQAHLVHILLRWLSRVVQQCVGKAGV